MMIGSSSSNSVDRTFQGNLLAQGMTNRKNKKLETGLADIPGAPSAVAETTPVENTPLTSADPDNLMARNFVKLDYKRSK